jgi:hypothetical protein
VLTVSQPNSLKYSVINELLIPDYFYTVNLLQLGTQQYYSFYCHLQMNLAKKLNFAVLINELVGVNHTCTSRDASTNNLRQRAYCLALNLNIL